jgi:hypothetical protein
VPYDSTYYHANFSARTKPYPDPNSTDAEPYPEPFTISKN